jgi:uncharacterized protein (DUF1330 family)
MPAYMIFLRESPLREPAEYTEYQRLGRENKGDFKITPLSVYGALEAVEGTPPDGVIILQFPTVADAKAWYNSPGYQAALPHRLRAATWRSMIVEGT